MHRELGETQLARAWVHRGLDLLTHGKPLVYLEARLLALRATLELDEGRVEEALATLGRGAGHPLAATFFRAAALELLDRDGAAQAWAEALEAAAPGRNAVLTRLLHPEATAEDRARALAFARETVDPAVEDAALAATSPGDRAGAGSFEGRLAARLMSHRFTRGR